MRGVRQRPELVHGAGVRQLLAQAGLEARQGRQRRDLRRLPEPRQRPPNIAVNQGYEIQSTIRRADRLTGSIYTFKGADRPAGVWAR